MPQTIGRRRQQRKPSTLSVCPVCIYYDTGLCPHGERGSRKRKRRCRLFIPKYEEDGCTRA